MSAFNPLVHYVPSRGQTEKLNCFCKNSPNLYIYGCSEMQQLLEKYLKTCGFLVDGFLVSDENQREGQSLAGNVKILLPEEVPYQKREGAGVILGLADIYYNEVTQVLAKHGFSRLFFPSEQTKFAIAQKVRPPQKELFWFETNIVDHCNLNCQMCDHFSPVAKQRFLDPAVYRRDMERMSKLLDGECRVVKLEGGEPLLHPQMNEFPQIARKYFPHAAIYLYTNGLLLKDQEKNPEGSLFEICRKYGITIALTEYPVPFQYEAVKQAALAYGVTILDVTTREQGVKFSLKHPFDLNGNQEKYQYVDCFCFNNCISLRDGKLYPCSILPNSGIFNEAFGQRLAVSEQDFLDIYKVESYKEIAEFVSQRPQFCRYCRVKARKAFDWKVSERTMQEWAE